MGVFLRSTRPVLCSAPPSQPPSQPEVVPWRCNMSAACTSSQPDSSPSPACSQSPPERVSPALEVLSWGWRGIGGLYLPGVHRFSLSRWRGGVLLPLDGDESLRHVTNGMSLTP